MARRIRRRPRVVWLPQDPFFTINSAGLADKTVMRASETLIAPNIGDTATLVIPVVRDASPNPLTPAATLADINDSGYRLRRIVGKFWVFAQQTAPDNAGPGAAVVTAAFIVLRTDPGASSSPQNTNTDVYGSNDIVNTEAPWIWRRSWIVVNNGSANAVPFGDIAAANGVVPGLGFQSNQRLGGNLDGPHIDQKTARVIGPDERLFLVVTATSITAGDAQTPLLLEYVWDVRVLGSMRSMVGNRGNASR